MFFPRRYLGLGLAAAILTSSVLLIGVGSVGAQQSVQLPDDVKVFLERDQVRRWANLIETRGRGLQVGTRAVMIQDGSRSAYGGPP